MFSRKQNDDRTEPQLLLGLEPAAHEPPVVLRDEVRPEVIAKLESLDDVIFAAIDGDSAALEASAGAWKNAIDELGHDTLEETRRQYLRHAQNVWDTLRRQPIQPSHRVLAAIEVIGLLVNHEQ
jgi:hypothetical protein